LAGRKVPRLSRRSTRHEELICEERPWRLMTRIMIGENFAFAASIKRTSVRFRPMR